MKTTDSKPISLGRHLLAEFYDCNSNILNNVELIEKILTEAAVACGATVVQKAFHMFSPYGVSGVVIIAESHLSIHTWPELGYAAVDLFTCGHTCDPKLAYTFLIEHLNAGAASYSELERGLLNDTSSKPVKAPFVVRAQQETVAPDHKNAADNKNAAGNKLHEHPVAAQPIEINTTEVRK